MTTPEIDFDAEMAHVDALVIYYRPRRGLPQFAPNSTMIESNVKKMYDTTFGHLDQVVQSIRIYRGGGGLRITFRMPMSREGQKAVIAAINQVLP